MHRLMEIRYNATVGRVKDLSGERLKTRETREVC